MMRARDTDRLRTGAIIDKAYADGQLTYDEHRQRSARAKSATTLADLDALTADLQTTVEPRKPVKPPVARPQVRWAWALAAAAAVVVAGVTVVWYADDPKEAAQPAPAVAEQLLPTDVASIVLRPIDLHTAAGLGELMAQYRTRFGTLMVDELLLYPDDQYAYVERFDPPKTTRSYVFRGGFDQTGSPELRDKDAREFDLSALAPETLVQLMASAPAAVALPDGKISHVSVEADLIQVYVSGPLRETGYLRATLDGQVTRVYPYRP